jgi:glycosyltransferase involved in cell wall biosynthesis
MVAETLGSLGTVDVCVLDRWRSTELELDWPSWVGDAEWCRVESPRMPGLSTLFSTDSPVAERIAPDAMPAAQARFFSRRYDLTWCVEPRGYEPVVDLVSVPVVLDLHNVLSGSLAHKRRLLMRRPWLASAWREAIDDPVYRPGIERRWRAWEARAARACDRVVVCSDVDGSRVPGGSSVVPNCYRRPSRPAGRNHAAGGPLHIGFVGFLDYQPNFDAVRWFADAILPRIHKLEPDAEFHVIGQAGPGLEQLGRRRGVRLLGFVPDLEPELADVSVLVAPIRFGGGTRFKILEGFAHEIPVVSTTVGAEGLEARDGEHILLRDDPAAFARAVVELHRDRARRDRLVAAAARLYDDRYTWERGVASVVQVVEELTAPTSMRAGRLASLDRQ